MYTREQLQILSKIDLFPILKELEILRLSWTNKEEVLDEILEYEIMNYEYEEEYEYEELDEEYEVEEYEDEVEEY